MELYQEVSDAILDLCLFADLRDDVPNDMRRHIDRLRELRARIDSGEWMDNLLEWDGDSEPEGDAA